MKKSYVAAIGAVLLVGMLVGCDGGSKGKGAAVSAKIIEPAMLISAQDAKSLTGVAFGPCKTSEEARVGQKICAYDKDAAFLQITLTQSAFMDKNSPNTPESLFKTTKGFFKDAGKIEGVGDDNFIAPPGLHIYKNGYYMTISTGLMSKDKQKMKEVGLKAVENLVKLTSK